MRLPPETLNLLLEYVREQGPYVLASAEDANYFRKTPKRPPPPPSTRESFPSAPIRFTAETPKEIIPPSPPISVSAKTIESITPTASRPAPHRTLEPARPQHPPEPLPPPEPLTDRSKASLRSILETVAPGLAILNEIPNDAIAIKIAERWKTKNQSAPISILMYQEPAEQKALLEQIAKALDVYFGPAKIVQAEGIEKEKQWKAFLSVADLKTIVVCDYTLWQLSSLMQFYKETPAQGIRILGSVPVFLLPDLSLYLKDPSLKRSLWKALCLKFS